MGMNVMDIQDVVEFLITAIEIVAIVILISLGNRRHWPLLCLDNKLDRQARKWDGHIQCDFENVKFVNSAYLDEAYVAAEHFFLENYDW